MSQPENPAGVLDQVLQVGAGFSEDERGWLLQTLEALATHLARWNPADVAVKIAVKHRDSKEQQVTLQADLPGYPPVVAKAVNRRLDQAVAAAKRELIRQIEDQKTRRDPGDNRHLREQTVRRP
jgi:ribosome-associated translation inhibitor RaiA